MDTTGGYQSLLGLTSINSNSSTIDVLEVENININGVIDLSQAIVGGLTTSQVDEGLNLYYTDTRVNNNSNVSSNTTHRDRKDNPHAVTATQVGINSTDDISEGLTNLYYTDIRFDDRLATKTTTSLAEGSNLYYTDARFDTRFGIKTTTNLAEGTNLYYTDARFDTRFGIKTTTDLTEGTNLYYTTTRANADFDTRLATKSTTNLTEGANLYYTDARFDARLATKTTTNLTEGANLYYTEARVSANTDVKANSDYRNIGHLPLAGGTLTGDLTFQTEGTSTSEMPALTSNTETINGVNYIASASSIRTPVETYAPWKVFNDSDELSTEEGWHEDTTSGGYSETTGLYTAGEYSTLVDGKSVGGEWVQLQKSTLSSISQFDITARQSQCAKDFTVAVSSDGTNFTAVYSTTGQTWTTYQTRTYTGITPTPGYYFRLIITAVNTYIMATLKEWRITFNIYGNIHSINQVLNLNGSHVDTLIEDVSANTAKVSADGSIDTHSDVSLLEVQDQQFLKYSSGSQKWENVSPTTTMIAEGTNLYYTDARFDTRLATKTTTDLTEGANLYYTDARFDTRLATKTTTDLTEGINLYYTDARFDTRFGIKTTTNLTEGSNLYYTEARVSANTDVKANSDYRGVGHLPLSGGTLTGDLTFDVTSPPFEMPALTSNTGNPDFIASASSELLPSFTAFEAFNDNDVNDSTEGWHINVPSDLYDGVDNVYNGTTDSTLVDGSPILGQWVQVRTTSIYAINQFYIQTRFSYPDQAPEDFTVAVSSDGTNFTSVYSTTGQSWVSNEKKTYIGITQTVGTYFRLITTKTQSSIYLCIKEWRITFNTGGNIHSISQVLNLNGTNVDTLIADVKTNTAYTAVGHLPLDGGTLAGDLNINGELNIGGEKITTGATNGLQLYGPSSDIGGPHIQAFVSTDNYPVFQQLNNSHGSIAMCFDAYADGFTWRSSSSGTNAIIYKSNTDLEFSYSSGVAAGGEVIWNAGFSMDLANGLVSFSNGVDVTGDLSVSGTVDGVDVAALETAVSANTAKVSYPSADSTKVGFISVTQAVDLDVMESDIATNNDKVSYPSADSTKVGFISVTQAVDLDTMESDIATNNNKVSADGSINTHSDVNITTPVDGHLLTYNSGEWKNLAPSGGTYVKIDGTSTMTGNLNMGNYDIDNVNQVFIDRNGTANNKIVLYDGGTPSTTAFYGFGVQSATLLYNVDASGGNHKFYYGGTNELFRIGDAGVYSYRDLDVKGDTTISGEMNIGGAKIARGATNGLQLYGTSGNLSGPHLQIFVSTDTYPTYQMLNWIHNDINMAFDGYFDGAWRSSSTASNLLINKAATTLTFMYDSGISLGGAVTWNTGFSMNLTNGLVTCNKGLDVTGNITVSGTVDGVDVAALNTTANNAIPLAAHNTYVPTIGDGTNNFTLTSATGHYTVIGNMCHVSFYVLWTSKGSASGTIRLSLPFTSATGPYSSMSLSAHNGIDSSLPSIGCFNLSATNYVVFFDKPTGLFAMNQTSFTNAGAICGSGFFYL